MRGLRPVIRCLGGVGAPASAVVVGAGAGAGAGPASTVARDGAVEGGTGFGAVGFVEAPDFAPGGVIPGVADGALGAATDSRA
jgi:hypothetical protein